MQSGLYSWMIIHYGHIFQKDSLQRSVHTSAHRPILSLAYPTGLSYHRPILSQAYPIGLSYHRPIPRAYPMPQAYPVTGLAYHKPILSQAYPITGLSLSYHRPILSHVCPYPITGLSYRRPIPRANPMPQAYPVRGLAYHKPILSQAYPTGLSLSYHRPILSQVCPYPITGLSLSYHRPILSQAYPTCFIQVNSAAHVSTTRPVQHSKLETFQVLNSILLTMATRPTPTHSTRRETDRKTGMRERERDA